MTSKLKTLLGTAVALAMSAPAWAVDNLVVKDGAGVTQTSAAKSVGGVLYAEHIPVDSGGVEISDPTTHSERVEGALSITGTLPGFAATPTFNCGTGCGGGAVTQSGSWSVGITNAFETDSTARLVYSAPGTAQTMATTVQGNASGIPLPVSLAAAPLATGAATSANQNASEHADLTQLHTDNASPIPPQTSTGQDIGATENAPIGTPVAATAAASSLVLKSSAGHLSSAYALAGSTAGFLMIFDATSAPSDGAVTPKQCIPVAANSPSSIAFAGLPPETYTTGIVAVFSSTGCFTKTASNAVFLKGTVLP